MLKRQRPTSLDGHAEHGWRGIREVGHREYVGGHWTEIGALQFGFLVEQGLRPGHVLVDIACGALRGGVHFIPYLEPGNYLGVDKERELIELGLSSELPPEIREEKRPELLVSGSFEFERLSRRPDFALAQSLFTHLPRGHIEACLTRLRAVAPAHLRLFTTFLEVPRPVRNPDLPHDVMAWYYTRREMARFGRRTGWDGAYIGEWGHPRGQMMFEYRPR